MTNRDPFRADFIRKFEDFYQCFANYATLKNSENQLLNDMMKPDINLVCNYEIYQLKEHMRQNGGLFKQDFEKLSPEEEKALTMRVKHVFGRE